MTKKIIASAFLTLITLSAAFARQDSTQTSMKEARNPAPNGMGDKSWESFLDRNDPVWECLPNTWTESAFIGNGRLGAMIYKGKGKQAGDPNSGIVGEVFQAARRGPWKAVRYGLEAPVELYNLEEDPGESAELSKKYPELQSEFTRLFEASVN